MRPTRFSGGPLGLVPYSAVGVLWVGEQCPPPRPPAAAPEEGRPPTQLSHKGDDASFPDRPANLSMFLISDLGTCDSKGKDTGVPLGTAEGGRERGPGAE